MLIAMAPADCQVLGHEHRGQAPPPDGAGHVDGEAVATKQCSNPAQQRLLQQVSNVEAAGAV